MKAKADEGLRRRQRRKPRYGDLEFCDHARQSCEDIGCQMPNECAAIGHPKNRHGRCQCGFFLFGKGPGDEGLRRSPEDAP